MRWFFRSVSLVLIGFIGVCIASYFLPATQQVETVSEIKADSYDIYEIISDLRTYPEWSGLAPSNPNWVFGGAKSGHGQTAAWSDAGRFGTLEILQDTPGELIVLNTVGPLGDQTVTLALNEQVETTQFYISTQRDTGGFPYLGRIAAWRQKAQTQAALDRAAQGLAGMVE